MDTITIYLLEACIFGITTAAFITSYTILRLKQRVRRLETSDA
jgi:hypothetical protein